MTNGLGLFLAFYILVGQPALLGWMLDNCSLYQLAGLNAGIFFIAWIISAMCKASKKKTNTETITSQLLGEDADNKAGVSVVKVQETTVKEIEVAKVEVNENKLEENIQPNITEEKKEEIKEEVEEEKKEEKVPEKPMRESVTIPKIVQPISGHTPKKRKRERRWGQRLILLLTLALAAVIAWTLWEFLGNRGIAVALFLGRILYLVIGKLFDINGFYEAKKLFTNWLYIVLILAGIGYGVYVTQSEDKSFLPSDFTQKVSTYVKSRFESDKEDNTEVNTGDVIYVFEGTGEVINEIEDNTEILDETGTIENEIENTENNTGITENIQPEMEVQPEVTIENQVSELSPEEAKKQVTMGEAIKSLLAGATLSTKTNVSFKYVSKSNELYPYFKTAQEKWMIGTDTDPSKLISCDTFITMKGIREGRDVGTYTKNNVKSVYWAKAEQLGKLNGCTKGFYVTKANL